MVLVFDKLLNFKHFWGHQIFWIMQRIYILYCSNFVFTFV